MLRPSHWPLKGHTLVCNRKGRRSRSPSYTEVLNIPKGRWQANVLEGLHNKDINAMAGEYAYEENLLSECEWVERIEVILKLYWGIMSYHIQVSTFLTVAEP